MGGAQCARRRKTEADGDGGSEGRGDWPTQTDTRLIFYVAGKEAMKRSDYWLNMSRTRLGRFKNLKTNNKLGQGEGRNGRGAAGRIGSEPTQSVRKAHTREKNVTPNSEDGSGGM